MLKDIAVLGGIGVVAGMAGLAVAGIAGAGDEQPSRVKAWLISGGTTGVLLFLAKKAGWI